MQALLLALIASAGVGIHVGETERVSYQEVLGLAEIMAAAVKERTARTVVIDSADWEQCRGRGPCLEEVRGRLAAEDLVIVRVIAGPLTLAVASERFYPDVTPTRTSTASLPKNDPSSWKKKLDGMVARLFPEPPTIAPPPPPPPPIAEVTPPPAEPSVAPWIVLGVSGAVAAVGLGFGISNQIAKHELESEVVTFDRRAELESRARTHGITATVLYGTAAAGALTALLWYAFD